MLAVVVVVIGALLVAVSPPQIAAGVRGLVCAVVGLGCDAGPGAPGSGASGGAGQGGAPQSAGGDGDGAVVPAGGPANPPFCAGVLGCVRAGAAQAGSAVFNVGRGAYDDVAGVIGLVTDPGQLVGAARYVWNNPLDAARQLVWDDDSGGMWDSGDYGGAIGRTVWNVGSWFIPGVNVGRAGSVLGDLGRISRAAAGVVDDVADLARRAEQAAARGNLDEAADLAAQAQRRAGESAADARRAGCRSAGKLPTSLVLAMPGPGRTSAALVVTPAAQAGPVRAAGCPDAAEAVAAAQRSADQASRVLPVGGIPPGSTPLYRGVGRDHPAYAAAVQRRAEPWDMTSDVTAEGHNLGNTRSAYTSWTRDPAVARGFAGPDGVILVWRTGPPPPGATWKFEWSPDNFGESEVLIRGPVDGTGVIGP